MINQTTTTIQIEAQHIDLQGAVLISDLAPEVTPEALGAATPDDVTTAVNGIQVGGRNYVLNSSKDIVIPTRTSEQDYTQAVFIVSSIVVNDNNKKTYTLSFDAYGGTFDSFVNIISIISGIFDIVNFLLSSISILSIFAFVSIITILLSNFNYAQCII